MEETPPAGGEELELASIDKSKLPLILERKEQGSPYLINGNKNLEEVTKELEDLLKD